MQLAFKAGHTVLTCLISRLSGVPSRRVEEGIPLAGSLFAEKELRSLQLPSTRRPAELQRAHRFDSHPSENDGGMHMYYMCVCRRREALLPLPSSQLSKAAKAAQRLAAAVPPRFCSATFAGVRDKLGVQS